MGKSMDFFILFFLIKKLFSIFKCANNVISDTPKNAQIKKVCTLVVKDI
jgi:hypothetical protein